MVELKIHAENHLLVARFSGAIDISLILTEIDGILGDCISRNLDLLLIDFTGLEFGPVTTLDRYRLGMSLVGSSVKLRKVAGVAKPELTDPDKLGEKVAQNRGANVRVFAREEDARTWLLAEGGL